MTEDTKITLSAGELDLVCDTNWILTKHNIIKKVYELFGEMQPLLENTLVQEKSWLPIEIFNRRVKISKGENYRQLPYIVLDYPGYFGREDTFAVRTFFWWGNFFSVTLHLSGRYKNEFASGLISQFDHMAQNDFYVCINNDSWQHHFENDNYIQVKNFAKEEFGEMLLQKPFIKIAKKISLRQWQEAAAFIGETFGELIQLLKTG